jgi:hypothetical protein
MFETLQISPPIQPPAKPAMGLLPYRAGGTAEPASIPIAGPRAEDRDSHSVTALSNLVDRSLDAAVARLTGGLSPDALTPYMPAMD